jgi:acetyl-CoA C-acetyltransferase
MTTSVIVAGARTPVGRLMGSLKGFSGSDLGAIAIRGALQRAGVDASLVDYVIMGQVLTAGAGQMPARQASVGAGVGWDVPSLGINKMCLSGLDAIALADQVIRAGEFEVVVAGGQESMSQAPHLLPKSREGYKYGDVTMLDHLAYDGLHDSFTDQSMGALTEQGNEVDQITRAEQDEYAAQSHQKAAAAWKDGVFADEVVAVSVPQRKGDPVEFTEDEGVRADTTAASLGRLKPAFRRDGTITAGSSSQISDGACAVVVMSKAKALELGLSWLCEIGAHGVVAGPDSMLQAQPANAITKALAREGISAAQLDVIEINEAFAAVSVASTRRLGVDPAKVNVNGGAIAIGHPIGMSGARITLHAALQLARKGSGYAVAALCGAGGQGDALILRR